MGEVIPFPIDSGRQLSNATTELLDSASQLERRSEDAVKQAEEMLAQIIFPHFPEHDSDPDDHPA